MVVPAIGQYGRYSLITMMNLPYSAMMRVLRRLAPPVSVLYYWTDCIDYSCVNVYPRYFSTLNIYILSVWIRPKWSPLSLFYCIHFGINVYLHILIRIGCKLASFLCVVLYFSGVLTLACMYVVTCPGIHCRSRWTFRFRVIRPEGVSLRYFVSCYPTRKCLRFEWIIENESTRFRLVAFSLDFRRRPLPFVALDCLVSIFNTWRVNSILTKLVVKWNLCLLKQPTILSLSNWVLLTCSKSLCAAHSSTLFRT